MPFVTVPEAATRLGIAPQRVKRGKLRGHQETTPNEQVQAQKEQLSAKDRQLENKDRQIGELHVLVQQAQAALPAPRDNRSWWQKLWRRD
jgi:hypothetical protein